MSEFTVSEEDSNSVKMMLDEDIKRWKDFLGGKAFPWDAPLYPGESTLITRLSKGKIR